MSKVLEKSPGKGLSFFELVEMLPNGKLGGNLNSLPSPRSLVACNPPNPNGRGQSQ